MTVLVTGAGGFIGSHLVRALVERSVPVRAVVHRRSSLDALPGGVEGVVADVTTGNMAPPSQPLTAVFHLAGSYRGSPAELARVHVEGTAAVLAATPPDARFVLVSSTAVYGWRQSWPVDETAPLRLTSAYGEAKRTAEGLVLARGGPAVVVRPTIVYGPGDQGGMVARTLVLLRRGVRWLPGDGANRVDLLHIDDLVAALIRVGLGPQPPSSVYVLAGPAATPLRQVCDALAVAAGVGPPAWGTVPVPAARAAARLVEGAWQLTRRPDEAPLSVHSVEVATRDRAYSSARAAAELGWTPEVGIEEGLRSVVAVPAGAHGSARPGPVGGSGAVGGGSGPVGGGSSQEGAGWAAGVGGRGERGVGSAGRPAALGFQWRGYLEDPDEGLGTVYERFGLDRVLRSAMERTGATSVLHAPAFGMMGIPGLDAVLLARSGVRVGLADHDSERLAAVSSLWHRLGLEPETHLLPAPDPRSWPEALGARYDCVFSFAALWWYDDPWAVVGAQARWADQVLVVSVPNKNVFMRLRAALWHRRLFDELNADALDAGRLVGLAPSLGLEVAEMGLFDLPPFPDTSVPLAKVVRAALARRRRSSGRDATAGDVHADGEARAWSWSILPYLEGDAPDLPARIERIGAFERHFPRALAPAWAHHRYVVMERPGAGAVSQTM